VASYEAQVSAAETARKDELINKYEKIINN